MYQKQAKSLRIYDNKAGRIVAALMFCSLILGACNAPSSIYSPELPQATPTPSPNSNSVAYSTPQLQDEVDELYLDASKIDIFLNETKKYSNVKTLRINGLTYIPNEVWQLEKLEILDLRGNNLAELPPEIGLLKNLRELDLGGNKLRQLPSEIGNLVNLKVLRLWGNQLAMLPLEIGKLSNLQQLDISSNELIELPPEIGKLSNLEKLQVFNNKFTELPPEIGSLSKLNDLNVASNNLTTLPVSIGNLNSLQYLSIANNERFSKFPLGMGLLTNLRRLDVRNTLFDTPIADFPTEIDSLKNLSIEYSFIASVSINEVKSLPDEKVVEILVTQWLEQYLSKDKNPNQQIIDFAVIEVKFRYKDRNDVSTFTVLYRVKPAQKNSVAWLAGNGLQEGEWIKQGNQHRLYFLDGYYILGHAFNG